MIIDPFSGAVLDETRQEIEGYAFNMFEASAALVYDNTLFGYTSPFAGQRYRFQLASAVGQLQFVRALADYRRYFFLRPFTLAVQGLHSGKYGRDAEKEVDLNGAGRQPVFYDQYLGDPWFVRGYYDTYGDCRDSGDPTGSACGALNSLFGSRIGVAKAELRFPLIEQLVLAGAAEFVPVEGIAFFDAGIAWGQETSPTRQVGFLDDPTRRGILTSAGVGARVNLLGYLIFEVDYVNAFALENGWKWEFNLLQGF
jgi:outer membrane protein assembly factor BamA